MEIDTCDKIFDIISGEKKKVVEIDFSTEMSLALTDKF